MLFPPRERNDEEQDRDLMKESVNVFVAMGYSYNEQKLKLYQDLLEKYLHLLSL